MLRRGANNDDELERERVGRVHRNVAQLLGEAATAPLDDDYLVFLGCREGKTVCTEICVVDVDFTPHEWIRGAVCQVWIFGVGQRRGSDADGQGASDGIAFCGFWLMGARDTRRRWRRQQIL